MPLDLNILGEGVYTPKEVARLIGATSQEVSRWTRGSGLADPLWDSYYRPLDNSPELSFADLIELRVVKSFRRQGISLQAIRYAINYAQEEYKIDRPLSSLGFKTDGREILMFALEKDGQLVSLSKKRPGQKVFAEIVKQSLIDLEYDGNRPVKWRPSFAKSVEINPARYFGDPFLSQYGVSTKMIASEFEVFKDEKYLSNIYEMPIRSIRDALNFEGRLDHGIH